MYSIFIFCCAIICAQLDLISGSQNNFHQQFNKQQQFNKPQFGTVGPWQPQNQNFNPPQHQQPHFQQQPLPNRNVIPITSFKNEMHHDGSYQYSYSTGNGIRADETGYLKNRGSPNPSQVAQGSYSYTAPNGELVEVRYIADELGFRAEGTHLPKAPPIPDAIQKSLQLIARSHQQQPGPHRHQQQPQPAFGGHQQQYNLNQPQQWNPQKWN